MRFSQLTRLEQLSSCFIGIAERRHRPEETAEYNIALAQNYTDAIAVRTHGARDSNSCMGLVCGRFHNVLNDLNCSCPPCVSIAYNSFRSLPPGLKNISDVARPKRGSMT